MTRSILPTCVVILWLMIHMDLAYISPCLLEAEELCESEPPLSTASCSVELSSSLSCKVYEIEEENCFRRWACWGSKLYEEGVDFTHHFNEETNMTELKIINFKERRVFVRTDVIYDVWWLLSLSDLPQENNNVTISNLPGRLNETKPLIQVVYCEGCPLPKVHWVSFRKLHKMQIAVSPYEDSAAKNEAEISYSVQMFSTNETEFSIDDCMDYGALVYQPVASGRANETLTIEDVYSEKFCFLFKINLVNSPGSKQFTCGVNVNMTEPTTITIRSQVDIPIWWIVVLVLLIIGLLVISIIPLVTRKGWLDQLRKRKENIRRSTPNSGDDDKAPSSQSVKLEALNKVHAAVRWSEAVPLVPMNIESQTHPHHDAGDPVSANPASTYSTSMGDTGRVH